MDDSDWDVNVGNAMNIVKGKMFEAKWCDWLKILR